MTCIAAVVREGVVHMAADSAGNYLGTVVPHADPKVVRRGEFIIGFTGDGRTASLVRHDFEPPPLEDGANLNTHMATSFCDALYALVESRGAFEVDKETGRHCLSGALLVGVRARLFLIDAQFGALPIAQDYFAIGSGGDVALGVLYACMRSIRHWDIPGEIEPDSMLEMAVEAAVRFVDSCDGEVNFVSTASRTAAEEA